MACCCPPGSTPAGRSLERAPVDLTGLVVDAVGDTSVAGLDLCRLDLPDLPVAVVGDRARLRQVLAPPTGRRRRYSRPGCTGSARLTADPAAKSSAGPRISRRPAPVRLGRHA